MDGWKEREETMQGGQNLFAQRKKKRKNEEWNEEKMKGKAKVGNMRRKGTRKKGFKE